MIATLAPLPITSGKPAMIDLPRKGGGENESAAGKPG
jgi:hypothetical protein